MQRPQNITWPHGICNYIEGIYILAKMLVLQNLVWKPKLYVIIVKDKVTLTNMVGWKRNLNLGSSIEERINNLLIETLEEETEDVSSEENLNLIQQDDQPSFMDNEDIQEINMTE